MSGDRVREDVVRVCARFVRVGAGFVRDSESVVPDRETFDRVCAGFDRDKETFDRVCAGFVRDSEGFDRDKEASVRVRAGFVRDCEGFVPDKETLVRVRASFVRDSEGFVPDTETFVRVRASFVRVPARLLRVRAGFVRVCAGVVRVCAGVVRYKPRAVSLPALWQAVRRPFLSIKARALSIQGERCIPSGYPESDTEGGSSRSNRTRYRYKPGDVSLPGLRQPIPRRFLSIKPRALSIQAGRCTSSGSPVSDPRSLPLDQSARAIDTSRALYAFWLPGKRSRGASSRSIARSVDTSRARSRAKGARSRSKRAMYPFRASGKPTGRSESLQSFRRMR